jgi:hypothetical protein
MRASVSTCDRLLWKLIWRIIWRLIWGTAISFSVTVAGGWTTRPADSHPCCYYDRPEIQFAPPPPDSEDYVLSLAAIDPEYLLTKVLIPIIYASLIIWIIWSIQRPLR